VSFVVAIVLGTVLLVSGKRISFTDRLIIQQGFLPAAPRNVRVLVKNIFVYTLSLASVSLLIILMFIGASPGSTGGGVKTSTVGATEVIYPERDMAIKTALKVSNPNVLECLPLPSGFGIQEIAPPEKFIGKSIHELDLRNKLGILVIAIRELVPEKINLAPSADLVIKDSDIMVIIGEDAQLAKLAKSR